MTETVRPLRVPFSCEEIKCFHINIFFDCTRISVGVIYGFIISNRDSVIVKDIGITEAKYLRKSSGKIRVVFISKLVVLN